MKYSNDNIGNRTRDLSACSAVPQPATPPPYSQNSWYQHLKQEDIPIPPFFFKEICYIIKEIYLAML